MKERTQGGLNEVDRERADTDETEFERERAVEQEEGIVPEDRGSPAAPSDRPEDRPPHPQDVIDIGDES